MLDTIILDIGGRLYKTTIATLTNSGSAYFQSLITRWMPLSDNDDDNNNTTLITTRTTRGSQRNKKKRSRINDDDDDDDDVKKNKGDDTRGSGGGGGIKTIFVDRDPDTFEEILYFMRCNCIKPATNFNPFLLRMVLKEAQFFAYDTLVNVCETKLKDLEKHLKKKSDSCSKVTARSRSYLIDKDEPVSVLLQTNEVLYIASAVLAGSCAIRRYEENEDQEESSDVNGCYLNTSGETDDTGDFQLHYECPEDNDRHLGSCISHIGLDQIHCGNISTNINFRQTIDLCITPTEGCNYLDLSVSGSASWHVHCWIGLPEDIPMLGSRNNKKKTDDDDLTFMAASSTTTMTAAMFEML